jgi:hypothetical protein
VAQDDGFAMLFCKAAGRRVSGGLSERAAADNAQKVHDDGRMGVSWPGDDIATADLAVAVCGKRRDDGGGVRKISLFSIPCDQHDAPIDFP